MPAETKDTIQMINTKTTQHINDTCSERVHDR